MSSDSKAKTKATLPPPKDLHLNLRSCSNYPIAKKFEVDIQNLVKQQLESYYKQVSENYWGYYETCMFPDEIFKRDKECYVIQLASCKETSASNLTPASKDTKLRNKMMSLVFPATPNFPINAPFDEVVFKLIKYLMRIYYFLVYKNFTNFYQLSTLMKMHLKNLNFKRTVTL